MNDESRRGKAIVPEESRELTLPSEMIHRGFELAVQIEHKQGIQPVESSTIMRFRKDNLIRGSISFMEWYRDPKGTYKLKESEKSESYPVVFLWASFDPDGLYFSCVSKDELPAIDNLEGNEDRYRLLNNVHDLNPFTVPVSSFGLYYRIIQPFRPDRFPSGLVRPIPKEEWKKIYFTMAPQGSPGYMGPATKEANPYFHIEEDCLEIIFVYICLISDSDKKRELVHKNPPVKFAFTVVDPNGEKNPMATHELYQTMFGAKNKKD